MRKNRREVTHGTVTIGYEGKLSVEAESYAQARLWITAAHPFLEQAEDLAIGWIRNDDAWHARWWIGEVFVRLQSVAGNTGSLVYPVEWERKSKVILKLKDLGLYDLCFWCEAPVNGKACGSCTPCKTHATALWEIQRDRRASAGNKKLKRRKAIRV